METLKLYSICTRKHRLSQAQKADFFVYILKGSAGKFFFENVSDGMQYNEIVQIMLNEYVSDAEQMQVKGTRETLRLRSFMKEKEIENVSDGLTKIVKHIQEL